MIRSHVLAALLLPSCARELGPAVDSVSLEPQLAYPDSLFQGEFGLIPDTQVDSVTCRWLANDRTVAEQTITPDGAPLACELDGRDAAIAEGEQLTLEVTPTLRRGVYDPLESEPVALGDHPVGMVTELTDGNLAFLDTENGEVQERIDLFLEEDELPLTDAITGASTVNGYAMNVAYTPEGDRVNVSSSTYGVIWEIDPLAREVLDWHQVSAQIYWFLYSEDQTQLYVTDMHGGGVITVDRESWEVVHSVQTGGYPIGLTRDPQGGYWVPHHHDVWTTVLELQDGELTPIEELGGPGPYFATVHPDQQSVWVACEHNDFVQVYSLPDRELLGEVAVGELPNFVFFTDEGERAWVTNFHDGTVSIVDVATMSEVGVLTTGLGSVGISARDDGRYLYVSNLLNSNITVIDTTTDTVVDQYDGMRGPRWLEWVR